jgi:hypothetical protein
VNILQALQQYLLQQKPPIQGAPQFENDARKVNGHVWNAAINPGMYKAPNAPGTAGAGTYTTILDPMNRPMQPGEEAPYAPEQRPMDGGWEQEIANWLLPQRKKPLQ